MINLNDFQNKFRISEYTLFESHYWIWSLRPHQSTLGSGILSLKRECDSFSKLEKEEFADLDTIINIIENTLKEVYKYDAINYLMLMMVDKQVHFHVIPRYKNSLSVMEEIWEDERWPKLPSVVGEPLEDEKLSNILMTIRKKIGERTI